MINFTASLADNVSSKVRQLDLAKVNEFNKDYILSLKITLNIIRVESQVV